MAQENPTTGKPTTPTSGIGISVQQGSTQGSVQSGKVQSVQAAAPGKKPQPNSDLSQAPEEMSTSKKIGIAILGIVIIFGLVYVLYLRPSNNTTPSIINQIIPSPHSSSSGRRISFCTSINSPGNYYISGNISSGTNRSVACIAIESSNVILNGKGNRIIGSGPYVQRYDVLSHNEHKAGEIDTGHMSRRYLDNGEYRTASQLNMIAKEFEEPNRDYAFAYKEYLELNNRKAR